ncbi:MAG: ribosome silencing factor [Burkholderiales bacterium]|nr:ribosome silencing factor [Burkholderiales bacterium]
MNPKKMGALVIDALEDIKAKNIVMINVSKLTSMFDYIVIASGDSNRQTKALANNVREKLKEAGAHVYGSEGEETGEWVLVDLGDIVVHVMQPTVREYYRLEELWRDGKIEFPKPVKAEKEDAPEPVKEVKKAATKKPATRKPASKTSTTKKPDAKKPAARKPAAKKPTTKKPAAKTPASTAKAKPRAPRTPKA